MRRPLGCGRVPLRRHTPRLILGLSKIVEDATWCSCPVFANGSDKARERGIPIVLVGQHLVHECCGVFGAAQFGSVTVRSFPTIRGNKSLFSQSGEHREHCCRGIVARGEPVATLVCRKCLVTRPESIHDRALEFSEIMHANQTTADPMFVLRCVVLLRGVEKRLSSLGSIVRTVVERAAHHHGARRTGAADQKGHRERHPGPTAACTMAIRTHDGLSLPLRSADHRPSHVHGGVSDRVVPNRKASLSANHPVLWLYLPHYFCNGVGHLHCAGVSVRHELVGVLPVCRGRLWRPARNGRTPRVLLGSNVYWALDLWLGQATPRHPFGNRLGHRGCNNRLGLFHYCGECVHAEPCWVHH